MYTVVLKYLLLVVPSLSATIACGPSTSYLNKRFTFIRSLLKPFLSSKSSTLGNLHGSVKLLIINYQVDNSSIDVNSFQAKGAIVCAKSAVVCRLASACGIASVRIQCKATQTKL